MRSDLDAYRFAPQAERGLRPGADSRLYVVGILIEIDEDTNRAFVSVNDSAGSWIPMNPGVYTDVRTVHVLRDPFSGRAVLVLGPAEDPTIEPEPLPQPPPPAPPTSGTVADKVTIRPTWSGTWRSSRGAYDRWNTGSYGGRSTLYQGSGFGSGPVTGLAVYGDQLVNLAATSITRIQVRLAGVGLSGAAGPATVQGSPQGSPPGGAPSSSGETATEGNGGAPGWADLTPATREAMRVGLVKGLALVGPNYWAVAGAGNGDGMVLVVEFTRPA